jgi:6,7-dimethyl-8-ribityllumazine synthase
MSDKKKNLSEYKAENIPSGKGLKIGVVVSNWNKDITSELLDGCIATLLKHNVEETGITIIHVPGTYELSSGASLLFQKDKFDGVVCLGCVIKGDTRHDEYINSAVAHGLTTLSLKVNRPVIFGVLTTENKQQAVDRSGGSHGNKGIEAAITVLQMAELFRNFQGHQKTIGF